MYWLKVCLLINTVYPLLSRISIECRKTKAKVITTANQNKGVCHQSQLSKIKTGKLPEARETQVTKSRTILLLNQIA